LEKKCVTQGLCVHLCGVAELVAIIHHQVWPNLAINKQDMKILKKSLRFLHIFGVYARTQWRNLAIFYYFKKNYSEKATYFYLVILNYFLARI
jgi:hypothetical protein